MAYQSWSVVYGEQPTAAKWNILGTNDASFNDGTGIADDAIKQAHIYNPYRFRARLTSDLGLVDNVQKTVLFDSAELDPNNNYDPATGEYTAPVDGDYQINVVVTFDRNTSASLGYGELYIFVGSSQICRLVNYPSSANNVQRLSISYSGLLTLVAGSKVKINVLANTVDAVAPKLEVDFSNVFSGYLVM